MMAYAIARQIYGNEIKMVCKAIQDAFFLPKRSWRKPLHEMAYEGLMSRKWTGIGLFTRQKELVAYLDYKRENDTWIEIDICLTIEKYRNQGYMQSLFRFLFDTYPNCSFRICTYEKNAAMIQCINRLGFRENHRLTNDRIDGTCTIYYTKTPIDEKEAPLAHQAN